MTATVVDLGALWQTIWSATVGGLLVTVSCSVAVLGAARAQEHRAAGSSPALGLALAVLGSLATAGVVVYGLLLVVD